MRILLITDEPWNDRRNGNNVITNWFQGFDAEFASIYCSPGEPDNNCCSRYFQVTDAMMAKSIVGGARAGIRFTVDPAAQNKETAAAPESPALYSFLKKITTEPLRLVREWIWCLGRYDVNALRSFIADFQPDVVFSIRMGSRKLLRLERIVHSLTPCPFFAFIGDDEYSLRQFQFSPFFWIRRFGVRRSLRKNVRFYTTYYVQTEEQAEYYSRIFPCKIKMLNKCGEFRQELTDHTSHETITLIYAGRLYCNRWKVLRTIAAEIGEANRNGRRFLLKIYTKDKITPKQKAALDDGVNSKIMGGVSQQELREVYRQADIALHVESSDRKNRLATRLSFSTKIMDCLESGCAVLAYCWEGQSGYRYLARTNSAFCVNSPEALREVLRRVDENPALINEYAANAKRVGQENHQRHDVQAMLREDFSNHIQITG